jgi:hypothetical protein
MLFYFIQIFTFGNLKKLGMSVFDATFNFVGGGKWSIIEATDLLQ